MECPYLLHLKEWRDEEIKEMISTPDAFSLSLFNDSCNYASLFKGRTDRLCLVQDKICKHMPDSELFYMTRAAGAAEYRRGSLLASIPRHNLAY